MEKLGKSFEVKKNLFKCCLKKIFLFSMWNQKSSPKVISSCKNNGSINKSLLIKSSPEYEYEQD